METIPNVCKRCWWYESGQCFNKEIAKVMKTEIGQVGQKITNSYFEKCRKLQKLKHKLSKLEKESQQVKKEIKTLKP